MIVQFFFFFLLLGILMFILDRIFERIQKQNTPSSIILSGLISGIIIGMVLQTVYPDLQFMWLYPPVMGLCSGILLAFAIKFELYNRALFRLFGTMTLALATGILVWIVYLILSLFGQSQLVIFRADVIIDFLLFAFVIHFGYAFSARIKNTLFAEKHSG